MEGSSPYRNQRTSSKVTCCLRPDYQQIISCFDHLAAYPLPRIDDLVYEISRFKYYSSLDLKSAYRQITIRSEDKPYTGFEANSKLYQFCRIPFGIRIGVVCFQRTIDAIRKQLHFLGTYGYVHNEIITGRTQQKHDQDLQRLSETAQLYNLTFNKKKSVITTESIDFFGYTITDGSLRPDAERLRLPKKLPVR